ncbi:uncharacterized protein LAJ45_10360 [Morchella importuna]|uniref:uncharacterized protein n=1 Tax=Morchella importuna TaxID=1174673 RepID=UPI001E8E8E91|nr:uncharacterized protein LAJ45_10360 [Morchella importuna]KAH8145560.1 hypothetical protein LAJ45_10360 [Morchella importuna]
MSDGQLQNNVDEDSLQAITRKESRLESVKKHFPYWIFPLISAATWFGILWVLIIVWLAKGQPVYISMTGNQTIAYISDIGASYLKPLFVVGCCITSLFFFLSLCAMRRNQALVRRLEKGLDWASILAGAMGAVSLILLSVFDTARHPSLHRLFLLLFMLGVVLSALFTTLEYRRLGNVFIERSFLKISYRIKQAIVVLEICLSIVFGATMYKKKHNVAAIFEWLVAFIFTFYVLSFFFDLRPKARTRDELEARREMIQQQRATGQLA